MFAVIQVFVLLFVVISHGSLFHSPSLGSVDFQTIPYEFGLTSFNMTLNVTISTDPCHPYSASGVVVVVDPGHANDCGVFKIIQLAQSGNVAAIIITNGDNVPGELCRIPYSVINIPVLDIGTPQVSELAHYGQTEQITVDLFPSPNPWYLIYDNPVFIFFQSVTLLVIIGLILYAGYTYLLLWKAQKLNMSIVTVCLGIDLAGSIFRTLEWLDVLSSRGLYPYWFRTLSFDFSVALTGLTNLLIGLFWLELIFKSKAQEVPFLVKYKCPFILVAIFLILLWLLFLLLAAVSVISERNSIIVASVLTVILLLGSSLILLYAGIMMIRQIQKFPEKNKILYRNMCRFISLCFTLTIIYVIIACSLPIQMYRSPTLTLVFIWTDCLLMVVTFTKIHTFFSNLKTKQDATLESPSSKKSTGGEE